MTKASTHVRLLLGCTLLGLGACGTEPAGPSGPGQLKVAIRSLFHRDDGAAVVDLTGSGINAVSAIDGDLFFTRDGNTVRVIVLLDQPGGIEFLVHVDDRSIPPTASLIEVADSDNRLRSSSSYWVNIEPAEVVVDSRTSR